LLAPQVRNPRYYDDIPGAVASASEGLVRTEPENSGKECSITRRQQVNLREGDSGD